MPHKHKRRQNDESTYDLPPTLIAKALPVRDPSAAGKNQQGKGKGKGKGKGNGKPNTTANLKTQPKNKDAATSRKKSALEDDTPRAFRQLMQMQERRVAAQNVKRKRDSEDSESESDASEDQAPKSKKNANANNNNKKKNQASKEAEQVSELETKTSLRILPGEKLSDFAARVDREMPLSQMKRSAKPTPSDNLPKLQDHKVTKHEKHLKRLQKQWREDDVRIKEKEAAEREEREEEMDEQLQLWKDWEVEAGKKKKRNPNHTQGKRKGGDDDDGPDPWAKLRKKRAAVNPFDVAQEPPQLKKPREIFKVRGGAKVDVANVPASVGSLRRREELASERRNIVEEYRRLMAEKRGE